MSKQNNVNPSQYQTAGREHTNGPDNGTPHEMEKQEFAEANSRRGKNKMQGKEGQPNFIPGEAPVGEKRNDDAD